MSRLISLYQAAENSDSSFLMSDAYLQVGDGHQVKGREL